MFLNVLEILLGRPAENVLGLPPNVLGLPLSCFLFKSRNPKMFLDCLGVVVFSDVEMFLNVLGALFFYILYLAFH